MSPVAENVIGRLDAARQKWWFFSFISTLVLAICVSTGVFLLLLTLDARFLFSQGMLLASFFAWVFITGSAVWIVARRVVRHDRSLEATARRVESEFPELGSHLINLVQLSDSNTRENSPFREAAVEDAARHLERVAFDSAAKKNSRWRRLLDCMQTPRDFAEAMFLLAFVATAVWYCKSTIPNFDSAANRLMTPWNFVPSIGKAGKIDVKPGDAEVLTGGSLEVVATLENDSPTPLNCQIFYQPQDEPETALVGQICNLSTVGQISNLSNPSYKATIPAILKPIRYRVEIGDSQSESYQVTVVEKPMVTEVNVTYEFPPYLGKKEETAESKTPDLNAPQYSVARLKIRPTTPVTKAFLMLDGKEYFANVREEGNWVESKIPLLQDGIYTIHLFASKKLTDDSPRVNRVQVVPDRPPTVELLKPARGGATSPGGKLVATIRVGDDYGIGRVKLEMKVARSPDEKSTDDEGGATRSDEKVPNIATLKTWTDFKTESSAIREHRFSIDAEKVPPGGSFFLRAVAEDRRKMERWGLSLGPQETATPWLEIKMLDANAKNSAALADLENLRGAIVKILEKQVRARSLATELPKVDKFESLVAAAVEIRTKQVDIQKTTAELVKSLAPSENEERTAIKRSLSALSLDEMIDAVKLADELAKLKNSPLPARENPEVRLADATIKNLRAAQGKIIDALRRILESARVATEKLLADLDKRPVGNLPDDARQKLEETRDKLNRFLKEQKKIIEASENLAKTPTEDFSEEQQQALRAMAAAEADWAKFMNELKSDLSKLPEQDFANASSLKEAVEIQVELKMAEDALTKKSVEIAVPLEQLGYERAEELVTNIEKWLPDSPDREKWSQEESTTDKDKEAPMTELPGELEDMIGELMEQEEDLFDEMEDISSSAADSLDKGAGWDTLDGPISNMSAKGVTGNRLPNSSEIGGRSGEGRQGKSSGEFVGDEAVGKGGRKTPSRLTPDPVVKGQIKDHGKESGGGATGGGKESGQGGEGLEGPLPRSPGKRDLDRLAGKQAALRNKAQGIDLQLQIQNYHRTDMKQMLETMSQVEDDLKAGRYQNALRQRPVLLEKLTNVKQYLDGEFQVRRDTTTNLPADIQKEILDSMKDPSPKGWEEMNRKYFERLSGDREDEKESSHPRQ
jgi:hypothetical protein